MPSKRTTAIATYFAVTFFLLGSVRIISPFLEQRFDGVPHQHKNGQDPQDGPIGDEQAFDSSHDEAERVMPPAGEKPRGHEYEGRKGQPEEDEKNGKADE